MSRLVKYLNLLVLSTFLVGQVQYAYSTYFCTMMQQRVNGPTVHMKSKTSNSEITCGQSQDVKSISNVVQLIQGDCIKLVTSKKSTLDSFTDLHKSVQHSVPAAIIIGNSLSTVAIQLLSASHYLLPAAVSPPLDILTLNSNLRI